MKSFQFLLIISFILTACTTPQTQTSEVSKTSEVLATLTPPSQIENTQIVPTPTEREMTIDELTQNYLDGKSQDLHNLTNEQRAALSSALAERKNEAMGINFVSFTSIKDEQYCLNPQTLAMEKLPANPSDEFMRERSFEVHLRVDFDEQGNVMYFYNDEWHAVPNSAGFDFSMEITNPDDTRIEFPKTPPITEGEFAGLTPLQAGLIRDYRRYTIVPVVSLKEALGEIIFESGSAFRTMPVFRIVTFETDSQGKPILAKVSLVIPSGSFLLSEEGGNTMISSGILKDYGTFWTTLEENQIYYLAVANDPQATIDYTSHVSADNIEGISLGHTESDDVSIVVASTFIKKKD